MTRECQSALNRPRTLMDRVELVPENGELAIVLRGDLAAMLSFATNKKTRRRCRHQVYLACIARTVGCGGQKPQTVSPATHRHLTEPMG